MTEPKITREQIEELREFWNAIYKIGPKNFRINALCDLALQAEAMQPRSIEEWLGETALLRWPSGEWAFGCLLKHGDGPHWYRSGKPVDEAPSHFFPLTSLPEPRR